MDPRLCVCLAVLACMIGCESDPAGGDFAGSTSELRSCESVFSEEFVACGGDVEGVWSEVGCGELVSPVEIFAGPCAGTAPGTSFQTYHFEGFRIFRPDGTYLENGVTYLHFLRTMPSECQSCWPGEREIHINDGPIRGYEECLDDGEECQCVGRELFGDGEEPVSGTYVIEGTRLRFSASAGYEYCRDGDSLILDRPWSQAEGLPGVSSHTRIVLRLVNDPPAAASAHGE